MKQQTPKPKPAPRTIPKQAPYRVKRHCASRRGIALARYNETGSFQ